MLREGSSEREDLCVFLYLCTLAEGKGGVINFVRDEIRYFDLRAEAEVL